MNNAVESVQKGQWACLEHVCVVSLGGVRLVYMSRGIRVVMIEFTHKSFVFWFFYNVVKYLHSIPFSEMTWSYVC